MAAIQGCHVVTSLDHRNVIVTMSAEAALNGRRPGLGPTLDYVSDDKYNYNPKLKKKQKAPKPDAGIIEDTAEDAVAEPRSPIVEICLVNADKDEVPEGFVEVLDLETEEPACVLKGTGTRYFLCFRRKRKNSSERPLTDIRIKSLHTMAKGLDRVDSGLRASSPGDMSVKLDSHTLEYNIITKTYEGDSIKSASDDVNARFFLWTKYGSSALMDIYVIEDRNKKSLIANRFLTCVEVTGEGHLADLNQGSDKPKFLCLQNDLTPYRFSSDDLDKVVNLKYVTPLLISLHQRSSVLAHDSIKCLRDLILLKFLRFTDMDIFCHVLSHISRAVCEAINICEKPQVIYSPSSPRSRDNGYMSESEIGNISGVKNTCQQLMAEQLLLILSQMYIKYHSVETVWGFLLTSTRIMDPEIRENFIRRFVGLSWRYLKNSLRVHRFAVYEEEKQSSVRKTKKQPCVESDYPVDLDEASMIKVLKHNADIIMNSVDMYHPKVGDAVKAICEQLFPEDTLRVAWPLVSTLFFLSKCADVPSENSRRSLELEANAPENQRECILNLSHKILSQVLPRLIKSNRILEVKPLQLVLRFLFPRLIARNFLNNFVSKRLWAHFGLEFFDIIISNIKSIKILKIEVLVLMDQMILPHLEEPGVLLKRRSRVLE
jgi:hypothetical protein